MPILAGYLFSFHDTLYDSAELSECRLNLFQVPVGMHNPAGEPKTFVETNMLLAGRLPSPNTFLIEHLHVALFRRNEGFLSLTDPAWVDVSISLHFALRVLLEGPAIHFAHPNIVLNALATAGNLADVIKLYAQWEKHHAEALNLKIEKEMAFGVDVQVRRPAEASILVILEGTTTKTIL